MNRRVFREYDIRGVADVDLDDATVRAIGMAIGTRAGAKKNESSAGSAGLTPGDGVVVVGRDCRVTSPRLFAALTDGIRVHAEVIDIGVVPSPVLYFAAHHLSPAAAVMITGSHNPPEDNGFKLMLGTQTLYGAAIASLRDDVERLVSQPAEAADPHPTRPMHSRDMIGTYGQYVQSQLQLGGRKFKLVLDAGNGAGGPTAVGLYRRLGFEVVSLYCDLDGTFPNHHPDPTQPSNLSDLIAVVKQENAELGIAFDGDADRIGVVDGTGRILWGDQILIILGKALLQEVPGAKLVAEVKCSQATFDALEQAGGQVEMWKVGHSLIKARMKETGALLAGEMSGHIFFAHRWLGFDDGIYAGARLLELLSKSDVSLTQRAAELPVAINTPELRVDCPDEDKLAVVASVTASLRADPAVIKIVDIDGVRASFEGGWGLVRASNTQPVLVMRCEATSEERLGEIRTLLEKHIAAATASVDTLS